jgi:hypothetical protein
MVLWALFAFANSVDAQAALAATSFTQGRLPPNARLTLRPAPGYEQLAAKVARVLALRGNTAVEIGAAPPPALLEAVAAGQVAMAAGQTPGSMHLLLGSALGAAFEATIELSPDGEEDARALALAIEALRDRAIETRPRYEAPEVNAASDQRLATVDQTMMQGWPDAQLQPVAALAAVQTLEPSYPMQPSTDDGLPSDADQQDAQGPEQAGTPQPHASPQAAAISGQNGQSVSGNPYQLVGDPRDSGEMPRPDLSERLLKVKPRLYFSLYGGASSESRALRTGVGVGGGLCVRGQCLLLNLEYPLPIGMEQGADDVRYRYPTFSCTFSSQPFTWGPFTPGVSVGVLSRIGQFERDMGLKNYLPGLDTDLGVRGAVEGSFQVLDSVDVVAQAGVDYALDRWQYSDTSRGSRVAPWLQAGIRVRPE